jgi:Transmembrane protein 43
LLPWPACDHASGARNIAILFRGNRMARNRITEVTQQGFGKRLTNSLSGALIGGIMFLGSFALLWWNEGRAIAEARALSEGAGAVVAVAHDRVDAGNEGKLLHVSGQVEAEPAISDGDTTLAVDALQLKRIVEMYQWREERKSKEQKKLGGGSETVTTYEYEQRWSDDPIDSSDFRHPQDHDNPVQWPLSSRNFEAESVRLGAFQLAPAVRAAVGTWQDLPASLAALLPAQLGDFRRQADGQLYLGMDPASPQVGDLRIRYQYQPEAAFSIVAKQVNSTLDRYIASNGREILLVEGGDVAPAAMFAGAQSRNSMLTWLVRAGGSLLMWIGLSMVFAPISRVLDVLPMLGTIGSWGIGIVTGLITLTLSGLTIGLAWVFYRPLLGGVIIAAVVALFVWSRSGRKGSVLATAGGPPASPPTPPPSSPPSPPPSP